MPRLRFLPTLVMLCLRAQTPNTYVDSKTCAPCHAKIAATYAQTGMARSFHPPEQPEIDVQN